MRCPFLREAQVKFCRASAFRKMIVRMPEQPGNERCSSPEYVSCPASKQHHEERPVLDHCPFLQESLVQYCAAGSVTKYIPYSESVLSQCGTDSHEYCEVYMAIANAGAGIEAAPEAGGNGGRADACMFDGMYFPGGLWYAANHMWLDVSPDGLLHVGIDAFLARILGTLNTVTFVTTKGVHRPTVVLGLNGAEIPMVFPNAMNLTKPNVYLRTNPSKIVTDPYGAGWLFEGIAVRDYGHARNVPVTDGLIRGAAMPGWVQREQQRVNALVHNMSARKQEHGKPLMADGGGMQPGFAQHLYRDEIQHFFNEFCMESAIRRKPL